MQITKKATREALSPLWNKILRTPAYRAECEWLGGRVVVERSYRRGPGPAWNANWKFYRSDFPHGLGGCDTMAAFVDVLHRYALPGFQS